MGKIVLVESLIEKLEDYIEELMELEESGDERNPHYDDYILDDLLGLKKTLYEDGVEEGRAYENFILKTEMLSIKIYDVVEVERFMSGKVEKVQIMSIEGFSVRENHTVVEFLGKVVRR